MRHSGHLRVCREWITPLGVCAESGPFQDIPDEIVEKMIETLRPFIACKREQKIAAVVKKRTAAVVLVLVDIFDSHNASAILRTAEALGLLEVHVVEENLPFEVNAKTASGAFRWLNIVRHRSVGSAYAQLRSRGYQVWASAVHPKALSVEAGEVSEKIALVFGNEHAGLTPAAVTSAHGQFTVPMNGFVESLNVSVAAAVATWEILARKRHSGQILTLSAQEERRLQPEWMALSVRASRELLTQRGLPFPRVRRQTTQVASGGRSPMREHV